MLKVTMLNSEMAVQVVCVMFDILNTIPMIYL